MELSDLDRKILKLLLQTGGKIRSQEISQLLGVQVRAVQRRRKRLENTCLVKTYSLDPVKFGWRKVDFLIATEGGLTMDVGKELLKRQEVTSAARSLGEHTIELYVETYVRDNAELLNLLEDMKSMNGVKDAVWTEIIDVVGRKAPVDQLVGDFEDGPFQNHELAQRVDQSD